MIRIGFTNRGHERLMNPIALKHKLHLWKLQWWYLYAIAILLGLVIGGWLTYATVHAEDVEKRSELLQIIQSTEQALDWQVVEQQSLTNLNMETPEWQTFRTKLQGVCSVTPHCKWLYITYMDGEGNIREIISTLNEGDEDYAQPNTIYQDMTPEYQAHFKTHDNLVEGPTKDDWGVWVSAVVMHKSPNVDGKYFSIGMDIDARNWQFEVYRAAILPLMATVAYLVLIFYLLIKNFFEHQENHLLKNKAEHFYAEASNDRLTGLVNRSLFEDRLKLTSHSAKRASTAFAVLFMDLDGFKAVNDNFGHEVGDEVLKIVANRISETVRSEDTAARFGGDEFALLVPKVLYRQQVAVIANKIINAIQVPMVINGTAHQLGISIGYAIVPHDTDDITQVVKMADEAMYFAKKQGKNQAKSYTELSIPTHHSQIRIET